MNADIVSLKEDLHELMTTIGKRARAAYAILADAPAEQKNDALRYTAEELRLQKDYLIGINEKDVTAAKKAGLDAAMLDRLMLNDARIEAMAKGLEDIAALPDPVGHVLTSWTRPNGLVIERVSVPLGVIGIIYESRPNVTADAGGLCIKSGNAVILRGGTDSYYSSRGIVDCLHRGLKRAGLPDDIVQLVPVKDRAAVGEMLTMVGLIDIIIPRGGKSLTDRILRESRIPTIQHLEGNCHTYVHEKADITMARDVLFNAKLRRTGVCGATESLVIDKAIVGKLPQLLAPLLEKGCEVRGDEAAQAADARIRPAKEEDWDTEYLDAILSVKVVENEAEAINHINTHGSHHTDAIITSDAKAAEQFFRKIDSAIVLQNASTQFADGGEFGMGAEIGISTGRLHARGPVGTEQLTTYKYVVRGNGQTRPN